MSAGEGGRGYLRASHADRAYVIDALKVAFVQGRLTKDEFDQRISQALASRTYGSLAALTADLPARLAEAYVSPGRATAPAGPPVNKTLMWAAWVVIVLVVSAMAAAFVVGPAAAAGLGVLPVLIAGPIAGGLTLDLWRGKRSHGQLPPPAQDGQLLTGNQDEGIGGDPILFEARASAPARHAPAHQVAHGAARSLRVSPGRLRSASL
jgi:hypothetical protein